MPSALCHSLPFSDEGVRLAPSREPPAYGLHIQAKQQRQRPEGADLPIPADLRGCPESYGLQVATMAGIPKSIVEKASVAGRVMRSKIAGNFKSSEQRAEFSTLHEEWLREALSVSLMDGLLDDDIMDTLVCIRQELKAHFRKAR